MERGDAPTLMVSELADNAWPLPSLDRPCRLGPGSASMAHRPWEEGTPTTIERTEVPSHRVWGAHRT